MLKLSNVSKFYNNNQNVSVGLLNINLELSLGEIVAVVGDSGSGKSTLLNVIGGVDSYDDGEMYYNGEMTSYFDNNDRDLYRKNNISFIFQKYNLISSYTVLENVMMPLLIEGKSHKDSKKEAIELIKRVGLIKRIKHRVAKLSGGEKQRCAIARALASNSKIILCDEPTGNLDSESSKEIIKLIKELSHDKLVIIVTHDYSLVQSIATRKIKLADGKIVEDIRLKDNEGEEIENKASNKEEKSSIFKFALLNIISTPKKNIMVLLLFLLISSVFFILSALSLSFSVLPHENLDYLLQPNNRLIVYNEDHTPLDTSILNKYNPAYNPFYEDTKIEFTRFISKNLNTACLTNENIAHRLIDGTEPKQNGDAILLVPTESSIRLGELKGNLGSYNNFINRAPFINNIDTRVIERVTGVGYSDYIKAPTYVLKGSVNESLTKAIIYDNIEVSYIDEEHSINRKINMYGNNTTSKPIIYLPKGYDSKNIKFLLNDIYELHFDYDIKYISEHSEPYFSGLIYDSSFEIPIYEASIYTDNIAKVKKELEGLGLQVIIPYLHGGMSEVNIVSFYASLAIIIIILIALYFLAYAIILRIYNSSYHDYVVFRSLGFSKGRVRGVVLAELFTISLLATMLSAILVVILKFTLPTSFLNSFSAYLIPIGFLIMIIMSLLEGRKINKRLFDTSLMQALRDGGNDD